MDNSEAIRPRFGEAEFVAYEDKSVVVPPCACAEPASSVIGEERLHGVALQGAERVMRGEEEPGILIGVGVGVSEYEREIADLRSVFHLQGELHGVVDSPAAFGDVAVVATDHVAAAGDTQQGQKE